MSLRTLADLFRRAGGDRTPAQIWEEDGCVGSAEYADCDAMSADYARLRRLERRVEALAAEYEAKSPLWAATVAPKIRAALKEAETDG